MIIRPIINSIVIVIINKISAINGNMMAVIEAMITNKFSIVVTMKLPRPAVNVVDPSLMVSVEKLMPTAVPPPIVANVH